MPIPPTTARPSPRGSSAASRIATPRSSSRSRPTRTRSSSSASRPPWRRSIPASTRSSSRAASGSATGRWSSRPAPGPGSCPFPVPDLVGVHTYRMLADAEAVSGEAEEAHSAIVIGGSFIGVGDRRVAPDAGPRRHAGRGGRDADAAAPLPGAVRRSSSSSTGRRASNVLLETQVEELTGNGRLLTGARTKDGRPLEGYLAIVGVGVVPNVELGGAGRREGRRRDRRRRAVPHVACRTSTRSATSPGTPIPTSGRLRRIEHWSNADAQGTHLGQSARRFKAAYDVMPRLLHAALRPQAPGARRRRARVECVLRGSLADGRLIGFHLTDDRRLVGAVVHGQAADVAAELEGLIREQPVVDDPARLLDESLRPAEPSQSSASQPTLAPSRTSARAASAMCSASIPAAARSSAGLPE